MSIKGEILKTAGIILLIWGIIIYGIMNFSLTNKKSIFSIIVILLFVAIYLLLLKNNLEEIKNEYENDINEYDKNWNKKFEETQSDLERRGMTFSGEAVKKIGKLSAYKEVGQDDLPKKPLEMPYGSIPKGELNQDYEDYKKYRIKKYELDFKRAKYKVLINIFKK